MSNPLDKAIDQFAFQIKVIQQDIKNEEDRAAADKKAKEEAKNRANEQIGRLVLIIFKAVKSVHDKLTAKAVHSQIIPDSERKQEHILGGKPTQHLVSLMFNNPSMKDKNRKAVIRFLRGTEEDDVFITEYVFIAYADSDDGPLKVIEKFKLDFDLQSDQVEFWMSRAFEAMTPKY